jgi:hypothetical protein
MDLSARNPEKREDRGRFAGLKVGIKKAPAA